MLDKLRVKNQTKNICNRKIIFLPFYGHAKLLLISPFTSSKQTKIDINSRLIYDASFSRAKSGKIIYFPPFLWTPRTPLFIYRFFKYCLHIRDLELVS